VSVLAQKQQRFRGIADCRWQAKQPFRSEARSVARTEIENRKSAPTHSRRARAAQHRLPFANPPEGDQAHQSDDEPEREAPHAQRHDADHDEDATEADPTSEHPPGERSGVLSATLRPILALAAMMY
jgi:hypothetical protein